MDLVDVWCFDLRVAVAAHVGVALIVCQDEDDVGAAGMEGAWALHGCGRGEHFQAITSCEIHQGIGYQSGGFSGGNLLVGRLMAINDV